MHMSMQRYAADTPTAFGVFQWNKPGRKVMFVLERQTGNFAVLTYAAQGCVCPPCTMHMLPDSQSSALPTMASALCMACCMSCSCTLNRSCARSVQCIFARDVCNHVGGSTSCEMSHPARMCMCVEQSGSSKHICIQ